MRARGPDIFRRTTRITPNGQIEVTILRQQLKIPAALVRNVLWTTKNCIFHPYMVNLSRSILKSLSNQIAVDRITDFPPVFCKGSVHFGQY
jgi:hypothetical protein